MTDEHDPSRPGGRLVTATTVGTALLAATSAAAAVLPDVVGMAHAVLSGSLFVVGSLALLWGYARGLSRSRVDLVSLSGLFFLAGETAPATIRRRFRGALAVEVAAVLVAAGVRPYTEVAFGILAPMFAMGLMAAWGGAHGSYPPRPSSPLRGGSAAEEMND